MSRVTVVIPAYNPGAHLDEALQSVMDQEFQDWDCVVVDDGSTEDLSRIDTLDARIRRVRQSNTGVSAARNRGILSSFSEYVAFLDADDVWLPHKLATQIARLNATPEAALCHSAFSIIDETGSVTADGWARALTSYSDLLAGSWICTSTVVARRECLSVAGLFDPLLRAGEDYDVWLKLARYYPLEFETEKSTLYRVHSGNASADPALMAREVTLVLNRHILLALERGDKKADSILRRSLSQAQVGWGCRAFDKSRAALGQHDVANFCRHFMLALQLAPFYTLKSTLGYLGGRLSRRAS